MNAELDKIKSGSSAVILCGGKSTRMAQDKAGLLIGKKTFLQQIEKNLKDADEILLSGFNFFLYLFLFLPRINQLRTDQIDHQKHYQ